MLTIVIPGIEMFDEIAEEFTTWGDVTLEFEHSLVSVSKWESIFEKPFLSKDEKTTEETLTYLRCMLRTPNITDEVLGRLTPKDFEEINEYISAKRSATWFTETQSATSSEVITSELIYYWMVALSIPFECQDWHLNRLLTLVRVCNVKNQPPKKRAPADMAAARRELNARRKAAANTTG